MDCLLRETTTSVKSKQIFMKKYEQFFDINNAFSLSTARSPWVALPMVAFSEFCFYIYASSDISFCDLILDL